MILVRQGAPAQYHDFTVPEIWYSAIAPLNIQHKLSYKLIIPGIHVGIAPHVHGPIYASLSVGMDVLKFPVPAYTYSIAYRPESFGPGEEFKTITNVFQGKQILWQINIGTGVFF